jgi:hypothetical protein
MTAIPVNVPRLARAMSSVIEAEQVTASVEFDLPWACGMSLYLTLDAVAGREARRRL